MTSKVKFKHKDIFLINCVSLIIGLCIYFYDDDRNFDVLAAILATGISISFGIRQHKIEQDRMFKELFMMFNERYDKNFNDKLNEIDLALKGKSEKEIDAETKKKLESVETKKLVIDYLNMCAEEYLWYTKGRIDENVWKSWEAGMKYFLGLEPIKEIARDQKAQKGSYYGLFDKLDLGD